MMWSSNRVLTYSIISFFALSYAAASYTSLQTIQALRNIEKSIKTSVDPCDDFYQYGCGNYKGESTTKQALENFDQAVASIMNNTLASKDISTKRNQTIWDKTAIYYQSCLNLLKPDLLGYLHEVKPGNGLEWPVVEEMKAYQRNDHSYNSSLWPAHSFDVISFAANLSSYGLGNMFFKYKPYQANKISIQISDTQSLKAPDVDYILSKFHLPQKSLAKHRNEILQSDQYWRTTFNDFKENEKLELMPYGKLKQSYPRLATFLETSLSRSWSDDTVVYIYGMNFIRYLLEKQWQPWEAQRLCNYFMLNYLIHVAKTHESKCVMNLRKKFALVVNYLYKEHYYGPEADKYNVALNAMVTDLRKNFLDTLNENRLNFSDAQLEIVKTFIEETAINIGILPTGIDVVAVNEYYSNLPPMDVNNFYRNDVLMLRHLWQEKLKCVEDESSLACHDDYDSSPLYAVDMDTVLVPFASLMIPMYHYSFEPLFAISSFSFLMGHELTHTIDSERLQHFATQTEEFENITETFSYQQSLQCLLHQSPTNYMDERVADLVAALVTYRMYSGGHKHDLQPSFTSIPWNRLFFLNLIQPFCAAVEGGSVGHDADGERANIIAMNMPEFGRAFKCPVGSKMNPAQKCRFY